MKLKNVEDVYPLSPLQQGMLFHTLFSPDAGMYFTQVVLTLEGQMDVEAFQGAWQRVVERHSILRTAFLWEELDEPLQLVRQKVTLPWNCQDWRSIPATEHNTRLDDLLAADRANGFDLARAPLMRFTLLHLSDERHWLLWSSHHILLDGWSMPLLLKEVLTIYETGVHGGNVELPQPRPFRDYISWLEQQDLSQAEAFWRKRLEGFREPTRLPVERGHALDEHEPDSAKRIEAPVPHVVTAALDLETTGALQALARQHRLTLNVILHGAMAVLLSRYTGCDDVVFGSTYSGRPASLRGAENMVGLFINTLPVRIPVNNELPVIPWLQELQERQAEMQQYEYSPLVKIQQWSDVPRGLAMFDTLVVLENFYTGDATQPMGGSLRLIGMRNVERTNYPLTISAAVIAGQLHLTLPHDPTRYPEDAIRRLAGHLLNTLAGMAANPNAHVGDLPLLDESERQQLLVDFNQTVSTYLEGVSLVEMFERQAAAKPDHIALIEADRQMTYAELNRRVNQLAHYLRGLGVGPEVPVGVCIERSMELVVTMLAVLKTGGLYFPLDTQNPGPRIRALLDDSQTGILLTHERIAAALDLASANNPAAGSEQAGFEVVLLDRITDRLERELADNPPNNTPADAAAYMIYTSGSTGRPKGTLITYGSLAQHCHNVIDNYQYIPGERMLQFANPAFDGSIEQVLPPMAGGITLLMLEHGLWTAENLHERIVKHGLTIVNLPPAYAHQLVRLWRESPEKAARLKVRIMIVGGDVLLPETYRLWRKTEVSKRARFINAYGPTEATVTVTTFDVGFVPDGESLAQSVPIGRPYPNRTLYVLDPRGNPTPIGVPGELHIGGFGLARGYLNRPALTAEKFIPDPFSSQPGGRLYRTGDLARFLPGGVVEFLGRIDQQVKIRGFRIELGEIEALLNQHPLIAQAAVAALDGQTGEKRLVAYVVMRPIEQEPVVFDEAAVTAELRRYIGAQLPDYMVPSIFIRLDVMPVTIGGKIDRRALPVPGAERLNLAESYVAPRNELEEQLVEIWEELLDVHPIGVTHNFFELGGHSLLATQLFSRIRAAFQADFPLAVLFESPTVEGLANAVMDCLIAGADEETLAAAMDEMDTP